MYSFDNNFKANDKSEILNKTCFLSYTKNMFTQQVFSLTNYHYSIGFINPLTHQIQRQIIIYIFHYYLNPECQNHKVQPTSSRTISIKILIEFDAGFEPAPIGVFRSQAQSLPSIRAPTIKAGNWFKMQNKVWQN